MKNILFALCVALGVALCGCVSLNVDEPSVCDTVSLGSVPAFPVANIPLPPQTFSTHYDFSEVFKKISDVSDSMTADVSNLSLSNNGDLYWVRQVDVSIDGGTMDTPIVPFAQYKYSGYTPGKVVYMVIDINSTTLLKYLQHPITLTFTVTGVTPDQSVNFTNTMCVDVNGKASKHF